VLVYCDLCHTGRGRSGRSWGAVGMCALALFLVSFRATPVAAATFVMVADGALADQAPLIAQVTVLSVAIDAPAAALAAPSTDYRVQVDRLLKGAAGDGTLTVRVPGGRRSNGISAAVAGAPRFTPQERLLLFLEPRPDGTYRVLQLFLGAFHLVDRVAAQGTQTLALRSLAGATQVAMGGKQAGEGGLDRPRDSSRFANWVAERAAGGGDAPADYFVDLDAAEQATLAEKYTLLEVDGYNERWFQFDNGTPIVFYANQAGQPGLAGGGFAEYQTSMQAWDTNPGTFINLAYGGTTATAGTLAAYNGVNEVTFNDPAGEITPFNCATGGIVAYTETFFYDTPETFKGVLYNPMVGAHSVTAQNISCFFKLGTGGATASEIAQSMLTHELGHCIGLAHSCGDAISPSCSNAVYNDAIMRTLVHTDNRGARLGADDKAAVALLYSNQTAPPPPPATCTANAQTLCLNGGQFQVTANWTNQFNNTSGQAGAIKGTDAAGYFYFSDPGNVELMFKVLNINGVFKVFYGELTNLEFNVTIRDLANGQSHTYSNTAGNCGGIDEGAFPAAAGANQISLQSACRQTATNLCLLGNRFAVSVTWANPANNTGGNALGKLFSNEVGTFVFTDPTDVELMTKLIQFSDRIAFYWGALTDFPYTITVTDTTTGKSKTYQGTAGTLCGGLDNNAF
jgi:hypothetical protein